MCLLQFKFRANITSGTTSQIDGVWKKVLSLILVLSRNLLLPKIIILYGVLVMINESKFALNHSEMIWSSLFIYFSSVSNDLPVRKKFVSSANVIECKTLKAEFQSIMYKINKMGPMIEPCGTPQVIRAQSELNLSITTVVVDRLIKSVSLVFFVPCFNTTN